MRVIAGPEKKTRVMSEKERLITAYHEMGHAIVGHVLPNCDPVHKVSIISRGQALGYTISLPTEDKFLTTRAELADTMAMTLGGRAAEEIVFSEITTGASNDLEKVTADREADGDALRHVRAARPARLRPRPQPALPRSRHGLRARLLGRDRARDRRRDPPRRRGGPPDRQGHPHRASRRARHGSRRSCSSARRSTPSSSSRCSTGPPRRRSSAPTRTRAPSDGPRRPPRPRTAPAARARGRRRGPAPASPAVRRTESRGLTRRCSASSLGHVALPRSLAPP